MSPPEPVRLEKSRHQCESRYPTDFLEIANYFLALLTLRFMASYRAASKYKASIADDHDFKEL